MVMGKDTNYYEMATLGLRTSVLIPFEVKPRSD
jgi:hypothetical protein